MMYLFVEQGVNISDEYDKYEPYSKHYLLKIIFFVELLVGEKTKGIKRNVLQYFSILEVVVLVNDLLRF